MHKSTAFRLVSALETAGLVEQAGDRGKYRLGMGILRLAGATTARLDVVQEARPICKRLATSTGETVNLAVLADGSALYLDQVAGSSSLQAHNWVGQHIPLHATSNGKVLLGGLAPDELTRTLGSLPSFTDATITTKKRLLAEVEKARTIGYAVAVDELEVGLTAVAAPIHNAHGDVIASLSLSGPDLPPRRAPHGCDRPRAARRVRRDLAPPRLRRRLTPRPARTWPLELSRPLAALARAGRACPPSRVCCGCRGAVADVEFV